MKRSYHSNAAFLDLLFNMLLCFVTFFIITLIHVKSEQSEDAKLNIDLDSYVMIVATWPESYSDDVDLYVRGPDGSVVFFRNKDTEYMHIDRDDLGALGDGTPEAFSDRVLTNREIVTVRKKVTGEYIVNAHLYAKRSYDPVPVDIIIYKVRDRKVIDERVVSFTYRGEEQTISRFIVDKNGGVKKVENIFTPVAKKILRGF
tara:strand:- start:403 stop:1008 length:606 start_codon:yes stop_codon:yes gene_type:complete